MNGTILPRFIKFIFISTLIRSETKNKRRNRNASEWILKCLLIRFKNVFFLTRCKWDLEPIVLRSYRRFIVGCVTWHIIYLFQFFDIFFVLLSFFFDMKNEPYTTFLPTNSIYHYCSLNFHLSIDKWFFPFSFYFYYLFRCFIDCLRLNHANSVLSKILLWIENVQISAVLLHAPIHSYILFGYQVSQVSTLIVYLFIWVSGNSQSVLNYWFSQWLLRFRFPLFYPFDYFVLLGWYFW